VWFSVVLGKSHYVLYNLVAAMQPRMLVTFDEELRPLPVSVRVGQVRLMFFFLNFDVRVRVHSKHLKMLYFPSVHDFVKFTNRHFNSFN
jgi:hypothetical protein